MFLFNFNLFLNSNVYNRNVYKIRAESDTSHWKSTNKDKKHLHFLVDVSGSMYRFNGFDQRLERMLEIAVIIMESLAGFEDKLSYSITGHSGDTFVFFFFFN